MTAKSGLGKEEAMKRVPCGHRQISGRLVMERLERFSIPERAGVVLC